jgi:hypothetical protein
MKSLVKLPPTQGIAAMQSINVVVINRWFMSVFFGTAIICLVLAILSVFRWQTPGAGYRLIGSLLYLLGTILVTIVCNVPLNDSLAAVDPTSANAAQDLGALRHNVDSLESSADHRGACSCGGILLRRAVGLRSRRRQNICPKAAYSFVVKV